MNQKEPRYKFIGGKRHNTIRQVDKVYSEGDLITLPKHTNKGRKGAMGTIGELDKTIIYIMINGEFIIHHK